jgi:hypothetical protein
MPDYQYVAVLDDILLAFEPQQAFFLYTWIAAEID